MVSKDLQEAVSAREDAQRKLDEVRGEQPSMRAMRRVNHVNDTIRGLIEHRVRQEQRGS